MTTTYSTTQTAQIAVTTVDTSTVSLSASSFLPSAGLYLFQISTTAYFTWPAYFNATIDTLSGEEEFFILLMSDPDGISTLSDGVLASSLVPSAFAPLDGTAESVELARKTIFTAGAQSFELDLALLTSFMCKSLSPTNVWNGSLLFWLCASQASTGVWTSPSLTVYSVVDYPNRDTGGPGRHRSRYSRCPISGVKIPRGEMVLDGYRGILVHPDEYDPPEPEPREWDDIPDANEDL